MDPHELSVCVHYFFSLMMRSAQERFETEIERSIRESAAYIRVHYAKENLSVPHLAGRGYNVPERGDHRGAQRLLQCISSDLGFPEGNRHDTLAVPQPMEIKESFGEGII